MRWSKQQLNQQRIKDAYFRWEFLRRNSAYIRGYEGFAKRHRQWVNAGMDPTWPFQESIKRSENPYSRDAYCPKALSDRRKFEEDWGIEPTDPRFTAPEKQLYARPWLNPYVNTKKTYVQQQGPALADDESSLKLSIDTGGPIEDVMEQIQFAVKLHKKEHKKTTNSRKEKKTRKHYQVFEDYLKAYDLRREGKSYPEIAMVLSERQKRVIDCKIAERYKIMADIWIRRAQRGEW